MGPNSCTPTVFRDDDAVVVASPKTRLVYLDSNIWIDIAERHQDVAQLCRCVVRTGQATFPLSYSAVAEVIEQPDRTQRARIAALMDELSKGVSFRDRDDIGAMEAEAALEVALGRVAPSVARERVLCPLGERFGSAELVFPADWSQPKPRSVTWLVDHLNVDKMRAYHAKSKSEYVDTMSAAISRSAAHFESLPKDLRRKRLLREERVAVVKDVIIPLRRREQLRVFGTNMGTLETFFKQAGEGSEERLEQMMRATPSQDLFCHIMAEQTSNYARKVKEQDFHDVEHAIVPAVYADVFVTGDGHLFDLLTRRCDIPATRGCQVVQGVQGLREVLRSLVVADI